MSLRCLFGWHDHVVAHARKATDKVPAAPMRVRCTRCGHETSGWVGDVPGAKLKFAGHLTASEVRRIRRRGKRSQPPVYVSPQVEAEMEASRMAAASRKRRGPAVVVAMRRKAVGE